MTDKATKPKEELEPSALPFGSNERDWLLSHAVRITNLVGVGFDVILYTASGVISGKTISGREYFDRVSTSFGDPKSGKDEDAIANMFATFGENYDADLEDGTYSDAHPVKTKMPQYIHLENCKLYHPGEAPFPGNDGVLWRGNLDKVVGFAFGSLSRSRKRGE